MNGNSLGKPPHPNVRGSLLTTTSSQTIMATAVSGPSTVILRSVLKTKEEFFGKAVADRYQRSAMGQPG